VRVLPLSVIRSTVTASVRRPKRVRGGGASKSATGIRVNNFYTQITDAARDRYEVPREAVDIVPASSAPSVDSRLYDVDWVSEPHFGLRVIRRSTQTVLYAQSI